MAFEKKTWKDRIVQYPNRRTLTDTSSNSTVYTVARNEGEVTQAGDAFSAANMNDLEDRVEGGFEAVEPTVLSTSLSHSSWTNGTYTIQDNRIHVDSETGKETTQIIMPERNIQESELSVFIAAEIIDFSQSEGQLVLKALGPVPTADIPIRIQFRGYY